MINPDLQCLSPGKSQGYTKLLPEPGRDLATSQARQLLGDPLAYRPTAEHPELPRFRMDEEEVGAKLGVKATALSPT